MAGPLTNALASVTNGLFQVTLDFGAGVFDGSGRWLEIGVRTNGGGAYAPLLPRQAIASTPYALRAANATTVASGGVDSAALQTGAVASSNIADGTITAADLSPALASNTFWRLTGNAGTASGTHFVGTADNQPLELRANNARVLRLEPNASSPNIVGGHPGNFVGGGAVGAVIAGGGSSGNTNRVTGSYSTVGGGYNNAATLGSGTVAGGDNNLAAQDRATVGGGYNNRAVGLLSTVVGGDSNVASNSYSTVAGGSLNLAGGSYSFAAGRRAKATNQGAFVWADSQGNDFGSTTNNQFSIRAAGGVRLSDDTSLGFGATMRQMINLWTTEYGLGIQANTLYQRSGGGFGWFRGGVHTNAAFGAGAGGTALMVLNSAGSLGLGTTAPEHAFHMVGNAAIRGNLMVNYASEQDGTFPELPGLIFGDYNSGELITSQRGTNGPNQWGLDIYAGNQRRMSIANNGNIGIGTATPTDARLDLEGTLRMNNNDVYLRAGTERGHGLGYRGSIHGYGVDGPFLYGFNGGALGIGDPDSITLRWDWLGNVWVSNNLSAASMDIRSGTLAFSTQMRQMLNLWNAEYGIGIQSNTEYFRTGSGGGFAWFKGGSHNDAQNSPGSGGTTLMRLDSAGNLYTTGAVNPPSDRNVKKGFAPVDGRDILEQLAQVPIQSWSYTNDVDGTRHVGPVAQDFHTAFGLGTDDKHIATVDADGVALAAIQGLNQKVEHQNAVLRAENAALNARNESLEARLTRLERLLSTRH